MLLQISQPFLNPITSTNIGQAPISSTHLLNSQAHAQSPLIQVRSIFDSYQSPNASSLLSYANPSMSRLYNQQLSSIQNDSQEENVLNSDGQSSMQPYSTLSNPMVIRSSHQLVNAPSLSFFANPGTSQLCYQQLSASGTTQNNSQRDNMLNSNENQLSLSSDSTLSNPNLFNSDYSIRNMLDNISDSTPNSSNRRRGSNS